MNKQIKKRLIAGLLILACGGSGWLLFISPRPTTPKQFTNLSQADSLLILTLHNFDVDESQVSTRATRVDSNFSRHTYTVSIPSSFPKMQFHAALKKRLSPYHIILPARVIFPDKNMHIYLRYHHTIVRTVQLKTIKGPQ